MLIGIDFDNTIVTYDDIVYALALREGLITAEGSRNKKDVRDAIRGLPDGEGKWQRLQGALYGRCMTHAQLMQGVETFFRLCRKQGVPVRIISHKTKYGHFDETRTDLRQAAISWMRGNRFFEPSRLGLGEEHVYFESTRGEKIERIRQLRCTHYIDDLEEIFREESFPRNVERILFDTGRHATSLENVRVFHSWGEIAHHFFDDAS